MANQQNFAVSQGEDALLIISMNPPTPVSGLDAQFVMTKRMGGTAIINKYYTSGFTSGAVSGIQLNDPLKGVYGVLINKPDTSGLNFGSYAYNFLAISSGVSTVETEGYVLIQPSNVIVTYISGAPQ